MFNPIKYTQELEKAGFTRLHAEVSLMLLIDVMNENFATKSDLKALGFELESKIQNVDNRVHALEIKMDARFVEMEHRLILKLGALMLTLMTLLFALIKLVPSAQSL